MRAESPHETSEDKHPPRLHADPPGGNQQPAARRSSPSPLCTPSLGELDRPEPADRAAIEQSPFYARDSRSQGPRREPVYVPRLAHSTYRSPTDTVVIVEDSPLHRCDTIAPRFEAIFDYGRPDAGPAGRPLGGPAATASFPSAPITSARTCPNPRPQRIEGGADLAGGTRGVTCGWRRQWDRPR